MSEDNKPKKISKWKFRAILFVVFFFRSFFPLFLLCLVCFIVGIFIKEVLIVGAILLVIDFIISIYFINLLMYLYLNIFIRYIIITNMSFNFY